MTFSELDTVVLTRDIPAHTVHAGDVGVVVHKHSERIVEVEFTDTVTASAVIQLPTDALRHATNGDVGTTRPLT
jgi:hypothetical protein